LPVDRSSAGLWLGLLVSFIAFIAFLPVDRSSTGLWLGLLVSFIAVLYVDRSSTGLWLGDLVDKPASDRYCPESETTCVVARWCRATNATHVAANAVGTRAATPAARGAGSSARQREREVHVDGDGDAAVTVLIAT
jgi:hypothetical protein